MSEATVLSLALLGLFGTGHCVGMCGPLILALPPLTGSVGRQLLYHLGRITTYSAVGALLGASGAGLTLAASATTDSLVWVTRAQLGMAVAVAAAMAWMGLHRLGLLAEPAFLRQANLSHLPVLRTLQRRLVHEGRGPLAALALGLLFGLLPCGLSYGAFAAALTSDGWLHGGVMVAAFGLGTLPSLLLVGTVGAAFAHRHRALFDVLAALTLIGLAASMLADALARIA